MNDNASAARPGMPAPEITDAPVTAVALTGADFPGLRPVFAVRQGQPVAVGEVLFTDRAHPEIAFVSPLAGVVAALDLAPRRMLAAVVVRADLASGKEAAEAAARGAGHDRLGAVAAASGGAPAGRTAGSGAAAGRGAGAGDAATVGVTTSGLEAGGAGDDRQRPVTGDAATSEAQVAGDHRVSPASPDASDPAALRALLLARGLWPAFVARPFGRIPAPDAVPDAILVTATGPDALCPDPRRVLAGRAADLSRGLAALAALTPGLVHVCQPPGPDLATGVPPRVRHHSFAGPRDGLAGAHLRRLHSVAAGGQVWTIEVQDVAAIGHLLATGSYDPVRVVALGGPRAAGPRLVRTVIGASLEELTAGEVAPSAPRAGHLGGPVRPIPASDGSSTGQGVAGGAGSAVRILSGPRRSGRAAAWLGLRDRQVSLLDTASAASRLPSAAHAAVAFLGRLLAPRGPTVPRPILPTRAVERALPKGFHPVPLMRALSVGDAEAAARLGALDLLEEDMAELSARCTSGTDYSVALRRVLDTLEDA